MGHEFEEFQWLTYLMMTEWDIVKAIQELNQSTSHLATINIVLTVAILILTGIQV